MQRINKPSCFKPSCFKPSRLLAIAFLSLGTTTWAQTTLSLEADQDTTLYQSQTGDLSNGSGPWLYFGRTNAAIRRALARFDLSAIPADAIILDAELKIEVDRQSSGAAPVTARLHQMLADWGEAASNAGSPGGSGTDALTGDATWLHAFFNDQFWSTQGGDFAPAISASTTIDGVGEFRFDGESLRADVQAWVENPVINFGWMIRGDEVSSRSARRMGSRENTSMELTLEVTYQGGTVTDWPGIGAAVQGSWFNPDRGGEGFVFDFFNRGTGSDDLGLVVYFYTYGLDEGPLYLVGSVEGLSPGSTEPIRVEVIQTQGTSFGPNFNATDVDVIPWGDLEIEFFDCESAEVRWFPIAFGFDEGSTMIERLVPLSQDVVCE